MTYLEVRYDLEQPVYVNNRVPVSFGITASGPAGEPVTQNVAVSFSFIEAEPADPANPLGCASSAIDVAVIGDGAEHRYDGTIWPTTLCESLAGRPAYLRVEFDGGDDSETGVDAPSVSFIPSEASSALVANCVGPAGASCVNEIDLQPTPTDGSRTLIDVRVAEMEAASSVALLPQEPVGTEALEPSLVIQSTLVVNGRDPYISATDPALVPAELVAAEPGITDDLLFGLAPGEVGALTDLPGRATMHYEIRAVGSTDAFLPLTIGEVGAEPTDARVSEVVIQRLFPGTPNLVSHELFAEGETRAALSPGGAWGTLTDFDVRGCFEAEFAQAGNAGDGSVDDCREVRVVLVREAPAATAASSFGFGAELERSVGSSRIGLGASLMTANRLDASGASSRVEGSVDIHGNLGRSFSINVAHALGRASLGVDPADTGYELLVEAFGQTLLSRNLEGPSITHEEEFTAGRSFSFPGLGFGFGPVRVGFRFALGGEVGLATTDELTVGTVADCGERLDTEDAITACGSMSRTITPFFAFTAEIEGGIDIRIARAGVLAELRIVQTDFPLTASLAWGLRDDGRILVRGNVHWELGLTLIQGQVAIVGRVGIRRFSRSLRVNLFSFSSPRFSRTLVDQSLELGLLD